MGRRASIVGSIFNIVHEVGVYERKKERERTVQSAISNSGPKEKPPVYNLLTVNFDKETRNTKIEIRQTTEYRTIERYVQQNYVKYPIYSSWKIRTKNISKSIKLTDENLESLNRNPDYLLREFAVGIIDRIDDEDLYPSWYIIHYLRLNETQKIDSLDSQLKSDEASNKKVCSGFKNNYTKFLVDQKTIKSTKSKHIKNCKKYQKIVNKIKQSRKPVVLKILSFGIYAYLVSDKRLRKYQFKLSGSQQVVEEMETFETYYPAMIETAKSQQQIYEDLFKHETAMHDAMVKKEREKTAVLVNEVIPLTASVEEE